MTLVDAFEREKALRFKFEADRIRSLAGACLIRYGIKKRYPDEDIHIGRTGLGKPYVKERSGYEFNLSHSGRIIAFAEDTEPVGIDVELVKEKDWRIFRRYFSREEMSLIENSSDPKACFFEMWTIREAFAKEEGLGLKILEEAFKVEYNSHIISYQDRTLFFRSFDHFADDGYKISICSSHGLSGINISELSPEEWGEVISRI